MFEDWFVLQWTEYDHNMFSSLRYSLPSPVPDTWGPTCCGPGTPGTAPSCRRCSCRCSSSCHCSSRLHHCNQETSAPSQRRPSLRYDALMQERLFEYLELLLATEKYLVLPDGKAGPIKGCFHQPGAWFSGIQSKMTVLRMGWYEHTQLVTSVQFFHWCLASYLIPLPWIPNLTVLLILSWSEMWFSAYIEFAFFLSSLTLMFQAWSHLTF